MNGNDKNIKNNNIMINNPFYTAKWIAPPHIKTLITTRNGGISKLPFSTFNLALHVGDNKDHVIYNRNILNKFLPNSPIWLNQVHGNDILDITNLENLTNYTKNDYDGIITTHKNIICAVMSADCIPILLTDLKGSFVAAIHAGWRGLANGIINNMIKQYLAKKEDIIVYMGPSISEQYFEVGQEVFDIFSNLNKNNQQFFVSNSDKSGYLCNLIEIARLQFVNSGINPNYIFKSPYCTFNNSDQFYSYRKDRITGRFASLIWLT